MDFEEFKKIYSENIKAKRLNAGIKQDKLAEKIELSEKYISDLETSRRAGSLETLLLLANALEVEPYELLLPPKTNLSYDTKRTQNLMKRLRSNLDELLDTIDEYLQK